MRSEELRRGMKVQIVSKTWQDGRYHLKPATVLSVWDEFLDKPLIRIRIDDDMAEILSGMDPAILDYE